MRSSVADFIGQDTYSSLIFSATFYVFFTQGFCIYVLWLNVISYFSANSSDLSNAEVIMLGTSFLISSQIGKLLTEYLMNKYDQSLILRRLIIVSILGALALVPESGICFQILATCVLGLSTGGDVNFSCYMKNCRKDAVKFGLSWALSSLIFHCSENL